MQKINIKKYFYFLIIMIIKFKNFGVQIPTNLANPRVAGIVVEDHSCKFGRLVFPSFCDRSAFCVCNKPVDGAPSKVLGQLVGPNLGAIWIALEVCQLLKYKWNKRSK